MKLVIKLCLHAVLVVATLLAYAAQAFAASEAITEDDISNVSVWRMVWIKDFAAKDWLVNSQYYSAVNMPEIRREDLPQRLERYIRSVNIHTAVISGELLTTRASAGCNGMGRSTRKVVATPARIVRKYREGKLRYETVPATYKMESFGWGTTQKACSLGLKIDGKLHDTNWIAMMEKFIMANGNKVSHSRTGETLEWKNVDGTIIARFEKLPNIVMHKHFWRLDPDVHEYDPVIKRYFGSANIVVSYPKLSSYTFCGPIYAPIDVTDNRFKLSDEMRVNPCEDLSHLVNGQRFPYTPNDNAVHNLLARHLPNVAQYAVSDTGDTRRLTLSDEGGNTLIGLISTDEGPWRSQLSKARIYDELDDYEWIIESSQIETSNAIKALSPIRIFSHRGYVKDGPKTQAEIISAQNCAITGLNIRGQSANIRKPFDLKDYDTCEEVAANALAAELGKTKKLLFDETHLIFYDDEWNEVMRAKRGKSLLGIEGP